jgi:predicted nucleic acid-binding protein
VGLTPGDLARATDLRRLAGDPRCSLADALTVALLERMGATRIATFDRRPYSLLRAVGARRFEFVP